MKRFIILSGILLLSTLLTGQPSSDPILRLNTEMHYASIPNCDTDAEGKYLLTASYDKTAKLWNASNGNLLKTFRIPIASNDEGLLYACAISPNGENAAVGGWTGETWDGSYSVYLFKTQTGEMYGRLKGLPNVMLDMDFSDDGKYLAIGLAGGDGVYIYPTPTKISLLMQLGDYTPYKIIEGFTTDVNKVTFDKNGRLAVAESNGYVRLYDRDFNPTFWQIGSGKNPTSLSFSPKGDKLAIGYNDTPEVDVFSGTTFELLYKPEVEGIDKNGGVCKLAFSSDGSELYGGCGFVTYIESDHWYMIRKWSDAGRGYHSDYAASQNRIMDLQAHPESGVLYCGGQPDIGRMTSWGGRLFYEEGEIHSFRNKQFKFLTVNYTGDEIGFEPYHNEPLTFSVENRTLQAKEAIGKIASASLMGITILDWEDSNNPLINGLDVDFLDEYTLCRCVDISPDGNKVVWGADWSINCTNDEGELIWSTPSQSVTWAVNISGNGKVVVATQGEGIINWYRMSDGELLLSLFSHPDNKRWVLFTPSGYYDASPGAEDLIGWHLNNGQDEEAYFFPASKFRQKYNRPEIVDNILKVYDVQEATTEANWGGSTFILSQLLTESLPPIATILSPSEGSGFSSGTVELEFSAKSPGSEEITAIKVLVDGRPSAEKKGFKPIGLEKSDKIAINVPAKDIKISLLVENKHGWSVPATIDLKWKGAIQRVEDILKPTLYILAIGGKRL